MSVVAIIFAKAVLVFAAAALLGTAMEGGSSLLVSSSHEGLFNINFRTRLKTRLPLLFTSRALRSFAFDPTTQRVIYQHDRANNRVITAKLDGSDCRVLINSTSSYTSCHGDRLPYSVYLWTGSRKGGHSTVFGIPSRVRPYMYSLTFDDSAGEKTLYTCGFRNIDGKSISYYFKYSLRSGLVTSLGTVNNQICFRLLVHDGFFYINDVKKNEILRAPLDNPRLTTLIASGFKRNTVEMFIGNITKALPTTVQPTPLTVTTSPTTVTSSPTTVTPSPSTVKQTPTTVNPSPTPVTPTLTTVKSTPTTGKPTPINLPTTLPTISPTTPSTPSPTTRLTPPPTNPPTIPPTPVTIPSVCREIDHNPLCPRMARSGHCGQRDVIKYCRKSCLC